MNTTMARAKDRFLKFPIYATASENKKVSSLVNGFKSKINNATDFKTELQITKQSVTT